MYTPMRVVKGGGYFNIAQVLLRALDKAVTPLEFIEWRGFRCLRK